MLFIFTADPGSQNVDNFLVYVADNCTRFQFLVQNLDTNKNKYKCVQRLYFPLTKIIKQHVGFTGLSGWRLWEIIFHGTLASHFPDLILGSEARKFPAGFMKSLFG